MQDEAKTGGDKVGLALFSLPLNVTVPFLAMANQEEMRADCNARPSVQKRKMGNHGEHEPSVLHHPAFYRSNKIMGQGSEDVIKPSTNSHLHTARILRRVSRRLWDIG